MKRSPTHIAATAICAIAAALASTPPAAQKIEKLDIYVGAGFGLADGNDLADYIEEVAPMRDAQTPHFGRAWSAFTGVKYKGVGAELGYLTRTDQEIDIVGDASTPPRAETVERQAIYLTSDTKLPLRWKKVIKVESFAKGGFAYWRAKGETTDMSGIAPILGGGLNVTIRKKIDIRLEFLRLAAREAGRSDHQTFYLISGAYTF